MMNKPYRWYLKYSISLSIWGMVYFIVAVSGINLGRAFAEEWSFLIFGPLVLLHFPLPVFNLIIFLIFIFKKVERVALVIPGAFVLYHLMYLAIFPHIISSETVYFKFLELALLVVTLSVSIKFIRGADTTGQGKT